VELLLMLEQRLVLTDDEAVALAVLIGRPWFTPLPTVDETAEQDLAAALDRGRRSLWVRELVGETGTPEGELAPVVRTLVGGPLASFFLVDGAGHWVPDGTTVYLYGHALDHIEMSHVVAAAGVHHFGPGSLAGSWPAMRDLASAVYAAGIRSPDGSPAETVSACLGVRDSAGNFRMLQLQQGAASEYDVSSGANFPDLLAALSWLESGLPIASAPA
jgi:hypothetical protein